MKILLDTQIVLWALTNSNKLSKEAVKIILDKNNEIYCSTVSFWEIQVKHMLYSNQIPLVEDVIKYCKLSGYVTIEINPLEIVNLSELSFSGQKEHKDPFDRLMISQAKTYGMKFLTSDKRLTGYQEEFIIEA